MATYNEPIRHYEAILSDHGTISYEKETVAIAGEITAGTVMGMKSVVQAAAPIPTIVGTGTGLMSALSFGPDVQVGSYVVTLTATSSTAAFTVTAPDGTALPNGAVGTAYKSSHVNFLISNGGTMTSGDAYTIVVTAGGTPALVGTGTGVVSGLTLGKYAMPGTYKVQLTTTSATSPLVITKPDGSTLPNGAVASAYTSDHINFTLSNAGTMTAGDYFIVVVSANSSTTNMLYACDPTAVDGTQNPYGVIVESVDTTSAAVDATVLVRLGEVKADMLQWKSTVTAAQKNALMKKLIERNIIARVV